MPQGQIGDSVNRRSTNTFDPRAAASFLTNANQNARGSTPYLDLGRDRRGSDGALHGKTSAGTNLERHGEPRRARSLEVALKTRDRTYLGGCVEYVHF